MDLNNSQDRKILSRFAAVLFFLGLIVAAIVLGVTVSRNSDKESEPLEMKEDFKTKNNDYINTLKNLDIPLTLNQDPFYHMREYMKWKEFYLDLSDDPKCKEAILPHIDRCYKITGDAEGDCITPFVAWAKICVADYESIFDREILEAADKNKTYAYNINGFMLAEH